MQAKLRDSGIEMPFSSFPDEILAMIQRDDDLSRLKHAIDVANSMGVPLTSEFWTGVCQEYVENFEKDCQNSARLRDEFFVIFCAESNLLNFLPTESLAGVVKAVKMGLVSKTLPQARFDEFWSSFKELQDFNMVLSINRSYIGDWELVERLKAQYQKLSTFAKTVFCKWGHQPEYDRIVRHHDGLASDGHGRSGATLMRQAIERLQQPQNEVKNKTLQYLHPEVWEYLGRVGKDHPMHGWHEFRPEPKPGEKQKQSKKQKQSNEKPPSRSWVDPTLFELLMKHHKCRVKCKTPEKLFLQSTTGENSKKTNVRYLGCECLCGQSAEDDTASDVTAQLIFDIGPEVTMDLDAQLSFSHSAHSKRHIGRKKPDKCNCHMVKLTLARNGDFVEVVDFEFLKPAADTSED